MDTDSVVGRLRAVNLPNDGGAWGPLPTKEALLLHRQPGAGGGARRRQNRKKRRPGPYLATGGSRLAVRDVKAID